MKYIHDKNNYSYVDSFFYYLSGKLIETGFVHSLECYVCEEQEGNKDKCAKTTKQCQEHEDACMTNIQWKCK